MNNADKTNIVINVNVYGDNNKVFANETGSHVPATVIVLIALAVLAVSFCCPELLPDFVRSTIGIVVNS